MYACSEYDRKVIFCHMYTALLDFFKVMSSRNPNAAVLIRAQGLMNPYMPVVLVQFTDVLKAFAASELESEPLLSGILGTLTKSLTVDDGGMYAPECLYSSWLRFFQASGEMKDFDK
jgi:U3 small nucleolar RNA-associated protein 10